MGLVLNTLRFIAAEALHGAARAINDVARRLDGETDEPERETLGEVLTTDAPPDFLGGARDLIASDEPPPEPVSIRPEPLAGSIEARLGGRLPDLGTFGSTPLDANLLRRRY